MDVKTHYDMLIRENNDPFRDPPALQKYMELWDGQVFFDLLELDPSRTVLEIGVGTGRIAEKAAGCCLQLTGIDISPRTIERARENLRHRGDRACPDGADHLRHTLRIRAGSQRHRDDSAPEAEKTVGSLQGNIEPERRADGRDG